MNIINLPIYFYLLILICFWLNAPLLWIHAACAEWIFKWNKFKWKNHIETNVNIAVLLSKQMRIVSTNAIRCTLCETHTNSIFMLTNRRMNVCAHFCHTRTHLSKIHAGHWTEFSLQRASFIEKKIFSLLNKVPWQNDWP